MFQIGEVLIYTIYGVCKVDSFKEMTFSGQTKQYYVLKPISEGKTTLTVPVINKLTDERLHQLLNQDDVEQLISEIPFLETNWIENDADRKIKYDQIIKSGNRKETLRVIKTIKEHEISLKNCTRKVHVQDILAKNEAEKLIFEEFSYVLNKSIDETSTLINNEIISCFEE